MSSFPSFNYNTAESFDFYVSTIRPFIMISLSSYLYLLSLKHAAQFEV